MTRSRDSESGLGVGTRESGLECRNDSHRSRDEPQRTPAARHSRKVRVRRPEQTLAPTTRVHRRWPLTSHNRLHNDVTASAARRAWSRRALRVPRLAKVAGFAATVIVTLGLGIGANAAMFGVVDRLMFRPYAYLRDPSTVHRVYLRATYRGTDDHELAHRVHALPRPQALDALVRRVSGFATRSMAVGVGDAARERQVAAVSASFFDFFDARPALGRFFVAAEDTTPRGADVAVLGYGSGSRSSAAGTCSARCSRSGNVPATIIGVAPEGFAGVDDDNPPAVYIPITTFAGSQPNERTNPGTSRDYNWGWMEMMVRRKPGVTVEQASSDLTQAYVRSWNAERELEPTTTPVEIAKPSAIAGADEDWAPARTRASRRARRSGSRASPPSCCSSPARTSRTCSSRARCAGGARSRVRLALGVSAAPAHARSRSPRASCCRCSAAWPGCVVAQWGGLAIRRLLIASEDASLDVMTDWRTLAWRVGAALVAGSAHRARAGAAVGTRRSRRDAQGGRRARARISGRARASRCSSLQGALSVVLLVGAGLFVRSLEQRAARCAWATTRSRCCS